MALQWAGWRAGGAVAALVHHRLGPLLVEHLLVVLGEDLGHVGHRPVAGLHGVPVEGAPQDVSLRKALVDDVEEGAGDVGLHHL